ncbi:permease prefix domain 1-containing protein [Agathobaculum desmolans]|uniref:permease prefix domain 1-containing protein n=1 Tax=Agathobaculum desmolans TaxID=39484 RepID=UPI00248E1EFA|nr:permease prefix domain 1-containing protein [Agathobaculum desmolans]
MEAIHNYVEALFAVLPQREDVLRVKDDMLANLEEKFRALLEEGRNEEEATGIVIASIGSGEELREQFGTQAPAAASAPAPARRVLPALALLTLVPLVMIAARLCFTSSLLDNAQVWWLIKYTAAGIAVVFALYQLACRQAVRRGVPLRRSILFLGISLPTACVLYLFLGTWHGLCWEIPLAYFPLCCLIALALEAAAPPQPCGNR